MKPDASPPTALAPLQVSIGVFVHNEQDTIVDHLQSIADSITHSCEIAAVLIVSSGSSDATDERVREAVAGRPNWRLLLQDRRLGKAAAVNLFLAHAPTDICVLANGDTILEVDAIERLCVPLRDSSVGMVGGHPVPIASGNGVAEFAVGVFWGLHHFLCLESPKMGELVAFRRVFSRLPEDEAGADEDWIHSEVLRNGLEARYAPEAILYNRGPAGIRDFLSHRRRMAVQHRVLAACREFVPTSRRPGALMRASRRYLERDARRLLPLAGAAALEGLARVSAAFEYGILRQRRTTWRPLGSSKGLTAEDVMARRQRATRQ